MLSGIERINEVRVCFEINFRRLDGQIDWAWKLSVQKGLHHDPRAGDIRDVVGERYGNQITRFE